MPNSVNIISTINSIDNYKLPDDYKSEYKDDDKLSDDYKPIQIKPDNLISTINSIDNYKLPDDYTEETIRKMMEEENEKHS